MKHGCNERRSRALYDSLKEDLHEVQSLNIGYRNSPFVEILEK